MVEELKRPEQNGVLNPLSYSKWTASIVDVKEANGTIWQRADYFTGQNVALEPT